MKRFRQSLQQVLDDFDCTLASLDQPLHTLLASHIDTVIRCLWRVVDELRLFVYKDTLLTGDKTHASNCQSEVKH